MSKSTLLKKFLVWRLRNISHRKFILILSVLIGVLGGLSAVLLKNIVHYVQHLLKSEFHTGFVNYQYLIYPLIGILLTVLFVKIFVKDNIGHGISRILYAISKRRSKIKRHNTYSSMIGSTFTVGLGGSVGLEAPIILTGAALGSNIGRWMHLNYKTTTLLIGCGSAAALAGIFKAPITAILFALEVLMLDLTMWSLVPLLISAVTGTTVAYFLMGKQVVFNFSITEPFVVNNIPYYILLGIITGLISVYFIRTTGAIENKFKKIKNPVTKAAIGGILLSTLIFLLPPLYGEGYDTLRNVLSGHPENILHGSIFYSFGNEFWIFAFFMIAIVMLKVVAMALTTGSGGVGGIFAPSLFIGGIAGFIFARMIDKFSFVNISESNFGLVGMAGMIAGVMAAPLTAIFLIAEITGGYSLFIPLMITATIAYLSSMYFEPHSIYAKHLAIRGELITHHKDKAVLSLLELKKVIEKDFITVYPESTLGELVKNISESKRNIFPVINEEGNLLGVVLLDNIRDIIFNPELYKTVKVQNVMTMAPGYVSLNDSMENVMKKFQETGAWNLPVLKEQKYVGFISKSKIFSAYRKLLIDFSDE
ncbi:MAG: chloride channel protein [Chlorobi bacterium]|nr:chloride channel protein [Chlorobiota bacterium]